MTLARLAGVLVAAAACVCASAASGGPDGALLLAVQRSNEVTSANVTLSERVQIGGRTVTTLRTSGLEEPRARAGSFSYDVVPAQAGLGTAHVIVHGLTGYVHYAVFDTLHARDPAVKSWLVVDTHSSLGVDPAGLTSLGLTQVREMTGLAVVGTGTAGGVPVTRYRGTLALAKMAQSQQLQDLLASVPSQVSAALLKGSENVEVSIGGDGFIHRFRSMITAPLGAGIALSITIDASLSNFNRPAGSIVAPPASEVMTVAQFQQITGTGASAANNALLAQVVLRASQVGVGYTLGEIPGGKLVQGEVTLNWCSLKYPSESLRNARLQVAYTAKGSSLSASNEVVTYKPGGAQEALREVRRAAGTCPTGRVANPPSGVKDLVRRIRVITDPRLLPGSVAILDTDTGMVKGKHVTQLSVLVYQIRGDVLSAVYGYGTSLAAVEKLALHAAEQSAVNLRRHVPAPTGLPVA